MLAKYYGRAMLAFGFLAGGASLVHGADQPYRNPPPGSQATVTDRKTFDRTNIGQRIQPVMVATPQISKSILTLPPGGKGEWMYHPVPIFVYILSGTLTVEHEDGSRQEYKAGESHVCSSFEWHRQLNLGDEPMRFLGVAFGGDNLPPAIYGPKPTASAASQGRPPGDK